MRHQLAICASILLAASSLSAFQPKEGYSKAMISRLMFCQPNASAPPLLEGLDAEVLADYGPFEVANVNNNALQTLQQRATAIGCLGVTVREDLDYIYVNGRRIDARIGTHRSLPGETFDAPYGDDVSGTWLLQVIGPMGSGWWAQIEATGVVMVAYLPQDAYIVGATRAAINRAALLPFVQFTEQMHTFMKPHVEMKPGYAVWMDVELANTSDAPNAIARLAGLSLSGITSIHGLPSEQSFSALYESGNANKIVLEPLVFSATPSAQDGLSSGGLPTIPALQPALLIALLLALGAAATLKMR